MIRVLRLVRIRIPADDNSRAELAELRRIYGEDVESVEVSETVSSVGRAKELVIQHKADVLEVSTPLCPFVAQCVDPQNGVGVPVIWAHYILHIFRPPEGGTTFEFSYYERILEIKVVTEKL